MYWRSQLTNRYSLNTYSSRQVGLKSLRVSPANEELAEYLIWKSYAHERLSEFQALSIVGMRASKGEV